MQSLLRLPPTLRPLLLTPNSPFTRLLTTTSSIDPTEVTHFNALASSWWDPHGPSRLLHLMNPLRHAFIRKCHASQAHPPPSLMRYLDIGCGGGIFAESAARLPHVQSVTGLDPSGDVLAVARAHARRDPGLAGLSYEGMGVEDFPLRDGGHDVVSCFEVLEHVNAPGPFLAAAAKHVRPGGWLVLSTIARTWTSWVVTKLVAEDVLGVVPRGTHEWRKYVDEGEVRGWFEGMKGEDGRCEWESARAMGVVYVPGLGWREVRGAEAYGNYFFAVRKVGGV